MGEGEVEVLVLWAVTWWGRKQGKRLVEPWEADDTADGVAVAGVVVVHYVVCVFEAEPFVGGEEGKVAERGGAADDGFVTAEFLHRYYVRGREVEGWRVAV